MGSGKSRKAVAISIEVVVYVSLACLAVVMVGSGISYTMNSWRAQHDGEVGTFTPLEQHCQTNRRGGMHCWWRGMWQSDADDRVIADVLIEDDLGTVEGDPPPGPVHPTLHHDAFSDDSHVVYRPGDRTWLQAPALLAVGLGGSAIAAWRVRRWSRRFAADAGRETHIRDTT